MICSKLRVKPVGPKSSALNDGGNAHEAEVSGEASALVDGVDLESELTNALSSGFVRILRGISSRMVEKVRRRVASLVDAC